MKPKFDVRWRSTCPNCGKSIFRNFGSPLLTCHLRQIEVRAFDKLQKAMKNTVVEATAENSRKVWTVATSRTSPFYLPFGNQVTLSIL